MSKWTSRETGAICAILAIITYAGMPADELTFDNAFVIGDDTRLRFFDLDSLLQIFQFDYWWPTMTSNLYRPLTTISYWFEYCFLGYGNKPLGYQLGNLLLHWVGAVLIFMLARRFKLKDITALGAAAIFTIHPIATEAVANIVGRADVFATIGVLAGLLSYKYAIEFEEDKERLKYILLAGLCGLLGLAAKESAIVLPALIALHGLLRIGELWSECVAVRKRWQRDAITAVIAVLPMTVFFFVTRWIFSSQPGVTDHPFIDNPLMIEGFWTTRFNALGVWGMQIGSLFAPFSLSNDYSFDAIPIAHTPFENSTALWAWLFIVLVTGFSIWLWCRRNRWQLEIFLFCSYIICMLPTSNLLIKIGSIRADRFDYLPSAFFWLLAGAIITRIINASEVLSAERRAKMATIGLSVLTFWLVGLTILAHARCYDWRNNLSLWQSAMTAMPESAKAESASGNAILAARNDELGAREAIKRHSRVIAKFRSSHVPLENWPLMTFSDLGACYVLVYDSLVKKGTPEAKQEAQEMLAQALNVFDEAMKIEQVIRLRWSRLYLEKGATDAPLLDSLRRNYAIALARTGMYDEAINILAETIRLLPLSVDNHQTLAEVYAKANRPQDALKEMLLVRIIDPNLIGDLQKVAEVAHMISPRSEPLAKNADGDIRLNLKDKLILDELNTAMIDYSRMLLKQGMLLDFERMRRLRVYHYGLSDHQITP